MVNLVTPRDLARTYSFYVDPWEVIEQYQQVIEYRARTKAGRTRIANRFEIPEGRVQEWIDEDNPSIPDPLRGVQIAEKNEWVPLDSTDQMFHGINQLVAELYSRGILYEETYRPAIIVPEDDDVDRSEALFRRVGLNTVLAHDGVRHSREVRPIEGGCVLGRVLACLGTPVGTESSPRLPEYLEEVDEKFRAEFLDQLLESRGVHWDWSDQYALVFEHRDRQFIDELAGLAAPFGEVESREQSLLMTSETCATIRGGV